MCHFVVTDGVEAPFVVSRQGPSTDFGDLGARLRETRKNLGLTQADFAIKACVSTNTQNRYETGSNAPPADYLQRIGEFGVDIAYVLTARRSADMLDPRASEVVRLIGILPVGLQDSLLSHIRELASALGEIDRPSA